MNLANCREQECRPLTRVIASGLRGPDRMGPGVGVGAVLVGAMNSALVESQAGVSMCRVMEALPSGWKHCRWWKHSPPGDTCNVGADGNLFLFRKVSRRRSRPLSLNDNRACWGCRNPNAVCREMLGRHRKRRMEEVFEQGVRLDSCLGSLGPDACLILVEQSISVNVFYGVRGTCRIACV